MQQATSFIPHVVDKEITVFFDEAHNFPPKVVEAMLTMFQPDESNRSQLAFGAGEVLELDFNKQVFILATTDAQKIAPPLFERIKAIELEDYSQQNLAEIMRRRLKGVEVEDGCWLWMSQLLCVAMRVWQLTAQRIWLTWLQARINLAGVNGTN